MNDDIMKIRSKALAFLQEHMAGVVATATANGPHASAVYYIADDDFSVYFMTLRSTRKYTAMKGDPRVAFTVGTQNVPQTLQIEGVATEVTHEEQRTEHIAKLVKVLTGNSTYYAPITQLDPSETVLMWIEPKWIRWGDFSSPIAGNEHVYTEIPVAA